MRQAPEFEQCFAELIAQPSVSSNDPQHDQTNRAVIDLLANWLQDIGFSCDIIPVSDQPPKFNLVARRAGDSSQAGGLILSGHSDTVPYDARGWNTDPFTLTNHDGKYYGLGTADMKSYFPIILETLERMRDVMFERPITVIATADEESSMAGARLLSESGELAADYCIIGEPTGMQPIYSHKGIIIEAFRIEGHSGHSSNPGLGNSALEGMNRVINELIDWREELQQKHSNDAFNVPVPTMNFGRIEGGDSSNRICAECEMLMDLRMLPGMDPQALRSELQSRVKKALAGSGLDVVFTSEVGIVPPMLTPRDSEVITMSEKTTGQHAGCVTFGTEGPFYNDMGIETVILGPGDIAVAHQPNEYLQIDRIEPMINVLSKLLMHFCEGK